MHVFKLTWTQISCFVFFTSRVLSSVSVPNAPEHEIFTLRLQSVKRAASDLKGQPEL